MKLLLVMIHDEDASDMLEALDHEGYRVTRISSTEEALGQGNATLLLGVQEDRLDTILRVINESMERVSYVHFPADTGINMDLTSMCQIEAPTVTTIFIIDVEKIETY